MPLQSPVVWNRSSAVAVPPTRELTVITSSNIESTGGQGRNKGYSDGHTREGGADLLVDQSLGIKEQIG